MKKYNKEKVVIMRATISILNEFKYLKTNSELKIHSETNERIQCR